MYAKLLALSLYEPSWQYYVKYRQYLRALDHPFRHRIEFRADPQMAVRGEELERYGAVAFYHHDPLRALYPHAYAYAKRVEAACNRLGIPLINRPDPLSDSVKSVQLNLLSNAGFNVARSFAFSAVNELGTINESLYPIFIRVDAGHDTHNEFVQGPFSSFKELKDRYEPGLFADTKHTKGTVAVQWIDTRFADGLYRRYRVFVCGRSAIPGNLHLSGDWYVHGQNALEKEEEMRCFSEGELNPEEKELFVGVNRALGLDFSAIDYSYLPSGEVVLWEANPHPSFPDWTEKEPMRSRLTNLISNEYAHILDR